MKKTLFWSLLAIVAGFLLIVGCQKEELSNKSEILSFAFESIKNPELNKTIQGNIVEHQICIAVPYTVNRSALTPTIEISPNATISPSPDIVTDFSNQVMYVVTAENGESSDFYVTVNKSVAPYVGKWISNSFDYGSGLMKLNLEITENGEITIEFIMTMTGDKDNTSIKGTFNPSSKSDADIMITQTHIWVTDEWMSKEGAKTFMFHFNDEQNKSMTFYYCTEYPRVEWCFQINVTKQ